MGQVGRSGREVGGWKKYKSGTGNGEIFSWNEPTGGQSGLTKNKNYYFWIKCVMVKLSAKCYA